MIKKTIRINGIRTEVNVPDSLLVKGKRVFDQEKVKVILIVALFLFLLLNSAYIGYLIADAREPRHVTIINPIKQIIIKEENTNTIVINSTYDMTCLGEYNATEFRCYKDIQ